MQETQKFAIVNNLKVSGLNVVAICSWRTHDVWGNARDGWEVNDSYSQGEIEIPCEVTISNVPRYPGAKDNYRDYPESESFNVPDLMISFTLSDRAIRKALDANCTLEIDGDDRMYYIDRKRDGKPLAELYVERWEERGNGG